MLEGTRRGNAEAHRAIRDRTASLLAKAPSWVHQRGYAVDSAGKGAKQELALSRFSTHPESSQA